ncbi:MAG: M48 family metallopeptidase [Cyclobacteriaceae bacterium]|nr:M48 family metallopeptidase [Cyclobacteriaceae bacterium]
MKEYKNIEKDYKKWILFNNQLKDFQNLYELYKAVDSKKDNGSVTFTEEVNENDVKFFVNQLGNEFTLELVGEENKSGFLEYLAQYYFQNQDVDEWYKTKNGAKEKLLNHSIFDQTTNSGSFKTLDNVGVHSKESIYYNLRVFISISSYLVIFLFIINGFMQSATVGLIQILTLGVIVLVLFLMGRITQGFFIGMIKGNAVKISEHQYPELFEIITDQAEALGLNAVPEVYISYGHFNAFVTKFARKKFLVLYSEVVETALKGDFDVVKFVIGHELGHIKRRHLNKEMWLLPSLIVPFLKQAHSRGCEYTCDRIGYHFSNKGAVEGVLILATGKEIHSKIDVNRYIEDVASESSFWVWLSEKFLTHPHISKRLVAIKNYGQKGY